MSEPSARVPDLSPQQKRALLSQLLGDQARHTVSELPLSCGQQALWLTHQLAPQSWAYNVLFTARVQSEVETKALHGAFQTLLARHPILRTTYITRNGRPEQEVHPHLPAAFEAIDASAWSEQAFRDRLIEAARQPFDLEHGPMLRVHLFTRSATDHVLLLVIHHIAIDAFSLGILLQELRVLYTAAKTGIQALLPPLDLQYTDYGRWQAEMLAGPEGERLWAYWQQQLAGELPTLSLPTDRPRPPVQTYQGASHSFRCHAELTQRLKTLARTEGATLYMTLLAAFYVLLYRYTSQEDLLVGTFNADRVRPEFRRIMGYFVNPLVLRTNLAGNPPFRTFLGQVRHTVLDALKHQEFPFPLLVERLQPARDASRSPLFQVAFVLQQLYRQEDLLQCFLPGFTDVQIDFGELVLAPFPLPQQEGQFDLTLEMAEVRETLWGSLKYNTDLFDAATMACLAGHFQTLLAGIVAHPDQPLTALPVLTEAERQQVVIAWNNTQTDYPLERCLHQWIEAQVDRTPDAIAMVCEDAQLTYHELNRRANQLAHHLRSLGVGPEVLVGLCVERSLEMVIGLLGILKAGGAYMPLDPAYPLERLAFMLEDARVAVLVTQQRLMAALPAPAATVVCLDADWYSMSQQSVANPTSETTPENLAYVLYTSGSTGRPKGVLGLHRGAVNRFVWMWETYPFAADEVCCQKTSLNFVDSVWELFGPLLQGIRVVIIPNDVLQEPPRLVQTLAAENVTRLVLVPSLLAAMLDSTAELQHHLPQLRMWITSGELLSVELCQRFRRCMPHGVLLNLYGSSEVAADVTWYDTRMLRGDCSHIPIGRPLTNTQMYLLDAHLQPVPIGVVGNLYAGGTGLARGYLNHPELTAERFMAHPFGDVPGARLYKTGDLARYLPDGNLEFLGRRDHQVKVHGYRIELGEIEAVLRQHPAVRESVVVARQDTPGTTRLVAYLVTDHDHPPAVRDLRGYLRQKLPEYMLPATFVWREALPLTPNGKVDRLALLASDPVAPTSERVFVAPRTPGEKTLAALWKQVLGVEQVGIYDNFFELGGHSLLAMQLMSRVRQTFGRSLPLATLLQAPTIADLAAYLVGSHDRSPQVLIPMQARGTQLPLFCLHPAGGHILVYQSLAAGLGPDQPLYGLQSRALTDVTQEYSTLDDMAAAYAAAIRVQQPVGPYYLLGWSMGGVLAMAVAKVLEHQSQCIAFVGLLDTYLPTSDDLSWDQDPLRGVVLAFGGTMANALATLEPVAQHALRSELLGLPPLARLQQLISWGRERQLLPAGLPLEVLQQQVALTEVHLAMLKTPIGWRPFMRRSISGGLATACRKDRRARTGAPIRWGQSA
jgi:amino acid adenylation domain-containing protein